MEWGGACGSAIGEGAREERGGEINIPCKEISKKKKIQLGKLDAIRWGEKNLPTSTALFF